MCDFELLLKDAERVEQASLAPNTQKLYKVNFNVFCNLWKEIQPNADLFPITPEKIKCVLYYYRTKKHVTYNTVRNVTSALRHYFFVNELPDLFLGKRMKAFMKGMRNEMKAGFPPNQKDPILPQDMVQLSESTDITVYSQVRDMTLYSIMYFGFLRFSEAKNLTKKDIEFKDGMLLVRIKSSKTDQEGEGEVVYISESEKPYSAMLWVDFYLPYVEGDELFPGSDTIYYVRLYNRLKSLGITRKLSFHSFRRGAAHQAALCGVEDSVIKKHGRWISEVYQIYTRIPMVSAGTQISSVL